VPLQCCRMDRIPRSKKVSCSSSCQGTAPVTSGTLHRSPNIYGTGQETLLIIEQGPQFRMASPLAQNAAKAWPLSPDTSYYSKHSGRC
jgi:hypothetical protein